MTEEFDSHEMRILEMAMEMLSIAWDLHYKDDEVIRNIGVTPDDVRRLKHKVGMIQPEA